MAKSVGGGTRGFHPMLSYVMTFCGNNSSEFNEQLDWFYGVLLPVLHHTGRLMMVGTPFSYNDLYAELEKKETFQVETYPAINREGEPLGLSVGVLKHLTSDDFQCQADSVYREYLCEPIHDNSQYVPDDDTGKGS